MTAIDDNCIYLVGMVLRGRKGHYLVEYRPEDAEIYSGQMRILGGHIKDGEEPIETVRRETLEEIGVRPTRIEHLLDVQDIQCGMPVDIQSFGITDWDGVISNPEGKILEWVEYTDPRLHPLDASLMRIMERISPAVGVD